jgi:hypothetical protein
VRSLAKPGGLIETVEENREREFLPNETDRNKENTNPAHGYLAKIFPLQRAPI